MLEEKKRITNFTHSVDTFVEHLKTVSESTEPVKIDVVLTPPISNLCVQKSEYDTNI